MFQMHISYTHFSDASLMLLHAFSISLQTVIYTHSNNECHYKHNNDACVHTHYSNAGTSNSNNIFNTTTFLTYQPLLFIHLVGTIIYTREYNLFTFMIFKSVVRKIFRVLIYAHPTPCFIPNYHCPLSFQPNILLIQRGNLVKTR